jgi:S-adenosylmethionine:tRNA ribosyltransferase-isomerase
MFIRDLDYDLPPTSIATAPAEPRDASRLLVVHPAAVEHRHFRDLPAYLRPGDLLVVNNTRVLPAKLTLRRPTGAVITGLFFFEHEPGLWDVLLRSRGRVKPGDTLLAGPYTFLLTRRNGQGEWQLQVTPPDPAATVLQTIGHVPLPPYITHQRQHSGQPQESAADLQWYQTVYAQTALTHGGSVAAPTAGLHFTPALLEQLAAHNIQVAPVELEVGLGTFLPVETETLEEHPMHTERYHIPAATIAALRRARAENRRIVVVGTTAVRTLEAAASKILDLSVPPAPISDQTNLLISPGFRFQLTDVLITNFHLPKSTLMALVAAFIGDDGIARLKSLYATAIQEGYRFYSYGDAMLIIP